MTAVLVALAATAYAGLAGVALVAVRRARAAASLAVRERQARDIHDNVVQGLTQVNWALEAGAYDVARDAARTALADAQEMVGGLLEDHPDGRAFGPGSLRRDRAASGPAA
jgi:signal transduction histidine kinase